MRVKICGITNMEDALLCQQYGVDAIGFIFYANSERYISPEQARKIIRRCPIFLTKVGVFVNEVPEKMNSIASAVGLTIVQLHGEENHEIIRKLEYPIIKSFRIKDDFDFSRLDQFSNCSILLDTYSAESYGGTGSVFAWERIPQDIRKKIILAGGISIENIETIYHQLSPAAVDLSSSLEVYPGKKDAFKVQNFMRKVNQLRYGQ